MLTLTDISKQFEGPGGSVQALQSVTLTVHPGELVVIRGPSGCGKSTLLLTAGGLLMPSSGQTHIGDQDIYALTSNERAAFRARHIGFVFQQFHLIPYLAAIDNVLAPSMAVPSTQAKDRAVELLTQFGLSHRIHHLPAKLSIGEQQRTALARALLNNPKLILADEPTGNLDPQNADILLNQLQAFANAGGTELLVPHDVNATSVANRTYQMKSGLLTETP